MRINLPKWLFFALVVLILASLMVPNFIQERHYMGTMAGCKNNLKNLGRALEMQADDHDGRYPRNLNSLVPEYLRLIPECDRARSVSYRYEQGLNASGNPGYPNYYYIE